MQHTVQHFSVRKLVHLSLCNTLSAPYVIVARHKDVSEVARQQVTLQYASAGVLL